MEIMIAVEVCCKTYVSYRLLVKILYYSDEFAKDWKRVKLMVY